MPGPVASVPGEGMRVSVLVLVTGRNGCSRSGLISLHHTLPLAGGPRHQNGDGPPPEGETPASTVPEEGDGATSEETIAVVLLVLALIGVIGLVAWLVSRSTEP